MNYGVCTLLLEMDLEKLLGRYCLELSGELKNGEDKPV